MLNPDTPISALLFLSSDLKDVLSELGVVTAGMAIEFLQNALVQTEPISELARFERSVLKSSLTALESEIVTEGGMTEFPESDQELGFSIEAHEISKTFFGGGDD